MSSIIYNLNGNDKTLILDTRWSLLQPFKAKNWTDLRLSMMISLTKQSDPNDPTGLFESFGAGADADNFYLGFKTSDGNLPAATNFFGVSTMKVSAPKTGISVQDSGSFNFMANNTDGGVHFLMSNGVTKVNESTPTTFITRLQDSLSGTFTGYATLLMFRMVRNDPTLSQVDALYASLSSNVNFDNGVPFITDTSRDNIRAITRGAAFTQVGGPFTFQSIPDALYIYYPYFNSRLRLHGWVLESY